MSHRRLVLALTLAAALAATASAAYVTGPPDNTRAALITLQTTLSNDKKRLKTVTKAISSLDKGETGQDTLLNEIVIMGKVAKLVEPTLGDQDGLMTALRSALPVYRATLFPARHALALAAGAQNLSKKDAKTLAKRLAAADAAIDALPPAKAPGPIAAEYATLQKLVGATAGFTQFDDGVEFTFVVNGITSVPATTGFDFTGDGKVDNVMASIVTALQLAGVNFNTVLADQLSTQGNAGLMQIWNVQSLDADPQVFAGFYRGIDTDGNPSDNFSGAEAFDVTNEAPDDHPGIRAAAKIVTPGRLLVDLEASTIVIVGLPLPPGVHVKIDATVTANAVTGTIGGPVPVQTVFDYLDDAGISIPALVKGAIQGLADVDIDGDGTKDAFSAAFHFTMVPAVANVGP